jgi:hypothetical protein
MKLSKRVAVGSLTIILTLILGVVFWPFILNQIIIPTSMAVWLLLRIFILSIDQTYYWGAIIILVVVFLFRLLPQDLITVPSGDIPTENDTMINIGHWRNLFVVTEDGIHDDRFFKQELIHLLLSLYASKQQTSTNYLLYEALQRGELPLPEHIHTFLFPVEPRKSKWKVVNLFQSARTSIRNWKRRWTGQNTADHYQMINEILHFIESSMEMKNDDGKFTPNGN